MKIIKTAFSGIAQAPPPPPPGGDPGGGGAPGAPGAVPPPPPPPSKYLFHEAAKNERGEWGAYFTNKATGDRFFAPELKVRQRVVSNEKTNKPDPELSKALARIEAAKLNQDSQNGTFNNLF